jgi:hypothetical protein
MEEALSFFRAFEVWIYVLLGLGGLIYTRKFFLAWQELREASFGLERESAQSRLNQSASVLVLLLTMVVIVFVLVYFVSPMVPSANVLATPTLDLLATPTTTLPAGTPPPDFVQIPPNEALLESPLETGCIPGQIEITMPGNGDQVSGVVEILGSADIPNFGFYKFEIKRPDETVWLTIQAGNTVVQNNKLVDWDTRRLIPGEYQLGLVVVDNQAQAAPACVVQLRVVRAPDDTSNP